MARAYAELFAAAAAALCGCGRIGFEAVPGDAMVSDTDGQPACVFGPFSTPTSLPGPVQSASDDWFPTPTADERDLYFYQYIGTGSDAEIVRASRAAVGDPFSAAVRVVELSSAGQELAVSLTEDALMIVFVRGGTRAELFEAQRGSRTSPFGAPVLIASLANAFNDSSPWLSPDGRRLTFASGRDGGFGFELYEATRADRADAWSAPVRLTSLGSSMEEENPTLSADGLEMFFSSSRPGMGRYDVWTTKRSAPDQPFAPPTLVAELSSALDDIGTRLSRDGRRLYLNYDEDRNGGQNAELAVASRSCE